MGTYITDTELCSLEMCHCAHSRDLLSRYRGVPHDQRRKADMCCEYCAANAQLDHLDCLHNGEMGSCRFNASNTVHSCGLCMSRLESNLDIKRFEKRVKHIQKKLRKQSMRHNDEALAARNARQHLESMHRRYHPNEGPLEMRGCDVPHRHEMDPTMRKEARQYHRHCRRELRTAAHITTLQEDLRRTSEDLLHRKACLHQCEADCDDKKNVKSCAQGSLRCRPGVEGCAQEDCDACMDSLNGSPLCKWIGCTMMSQNDCLQSSCSGLYNVCDSCLIPYKEKE